MRILSAGGLALCLVLAAGIPTVGQIDPIGPPAVETVLEAEITAPETVEAGRLVRLRAVCDGGRVFAWTVSGAETEDWEAVGPLCLFATPRPGKYTVVLAVAGGTGTDPSLVQVQHVLTVTGGSGPVPRPDDPTPTPDPGPSLPQGRFGLAQVAYDAMRTANADRAMTARICDNFASSAAAASRGAGLGDPWTPKRLVEDLAKRNRATLQTVERQQQWRELLMPTGEAIADLIDKGTMAETSIQDHIEAWGEIATGLQAWGAG